ncbi:MAG: PEGA domain-containing protein [Archangium sp.]
MTLLLALLLAANPMADGARLFDAGDFAGALRTYDAGLKSAPDAVTRAQLHIGRARCLYALRRTADVDAAFEAALTEAPTAALDADVSPGLRATFDATRTRLAGSLTIETEPAGSAVKIDGALVGKSPTTQLLPVGRHEISVLDANGAAAVQREVIVAPRRQQTMVLQLSAAAPQVAIAQPPVVAKPAEPASGGGPWPIEPGVVVRAATDFRGLAIEAGATIVGKYFLVEVDAVMGGSFGVGLRAGGRYSFLGGLLGVQLTADGVLFLQPVAAPGGGGSLGFVVHPLDFLDVILEVSARGVAAAPGFRPAYVLGGLTLRARWPTGLDR